MQYLGERYYDPKLGRFTQEDPAQQGTNLYIYCGNDPVNRIDPSGLWYKNAQGGWVAERGDTLWGLAARPDVYGDGNRWREFGFKRDPRTLQIGEVIKVGGGSNNNSSTNKNTGSGSNNNTGGGSTNNNNGDGGGSSGGKPSGGSIEYNIGWNYKNGIGYDREAVVRYIDKWWDSYNPEFQKYRAGITGMADCANFVSQCLLAGGILMTGSNNDGWHSYKISTQKSFLGIKYTNITWNVSEAWRLVRMQYSYFRDSIYTRNPITITSISDIANAISWYGIQQGDLLYFDDDGDGTPNHAAIIRTVGGTMIYYAAHSNNRREQGIGEYLKKKPSIFSQIYILRIN